MIMRDLIEEHRQEITDDGYGGVSTELTPYNSFSCKVSVSNDVAKATAYGVLTEQVLNVVSFFPFSADSIYFYNNKKYSMRGCIKQGRMFYATLVEVV